MLPKRPPRVGQVGFIYEPPYRIQGVSIAGEQTCVQVPELDVAFDIGLCPRVALASPYVALSHGHMDHVAGLPYYFSQRIFQKLGTGKCIAHPTLAASLSRMMDAWADVEHQRTPYELVPLASGEQVEIKNNIFLRAFEVSHTVDANAYVAIEHRSKLREEFHGLPQSQLRDLKAAGTEITKILEIPLVAYTGDTQLSPALYSDEFANSQVVITECTFFEEDHRDRAKIGKHLHIEDVRQLLNVWSAKAVVLVHLSRRTNLTAARKMLRDTLGEEQAERVHFLMDHQANSMRYEAQQRMLQP